MAGGTRQQQVLPGGFLPYSRRDRFVELELLLAWACGGIGARDWRDSAWSSSRRGCCQAVEDVGRRAGEEASCRVADPFARRHAASIDARSRLPGDGERGRVGVGRKRRGGCAGKSGILQWARPVRHLRMDGDGDQADC
jgi:hypothetical protein